MDTNVLYSGTLFEGTESDLLDSKRVELYVSEYILNELLEVFRRKGLSTEMVSRFVHYSNIRVIADREYEGSDDFNVYLKKSKDLVSDPNDRPVFVFAEYVMSKNPDAYLVTGDEHLLTMEVKRELRGKVMKPREFMEKFSQI